MIIAYSHKIGDCVYLKHCATHGEMKCSTVRRIVIDGVKTPEVYYELADGSTYSEREICNRYEAVGMVIQYHKNHIEQYSKLQKEIWDDRESDSGWERDRIPD